VLVSKSKEGGPASFKGNVYAKKTGQNLVRKNRSVDLQGVSKLFFSDPSLVTKPTHGRLPTKKGAQKKVP